MKREIMFYKQKQVVAVLSVMIKQSMPNENSDCDSLTSFCECSQKKNVSK